MKIGIIVYSQTGNTLSVAEKVYQKYKDNGADVTLEQVKIAEQVKNNPSDIQLVNVPSPDKYDKIIFGAPVHAFSLCPAMKKYMKQIGNIAGKEISYLITHQFPFAWMGGNSGLKQLKSLAEQKGGKTESSAIIHWGNKNRPNDIAQAVSLLSAD